MRFEFTPGRIGGATVAGNGEGGARYSLEQWHGAAMQRLSPSGGCGGSWRSGATEARRWRNLLAFRLLFGGGARPTTLASWTEAQSTMKGNGGRHRDRGRWWWRAKLCIREREDEQ